MFRLKKFRIPDGSRPRVIGRNLTVVSAISEDWRMHQEFLMENLRLLKEFLSGKVMVADPKSLREFLDVTKRHRCRIPCKEIVAITNNEETFDDFRTVKSEKVVRAMARHEEVIIFGKTAVETLLPIANNMIIFHVGVACQGKRQFPDLKKGDWTSRPCHQLSRAENGIPYFVLKYTRKQLRA